MAKIADMQEVGLELLKPYERNAKLHGEEQILKLMDSIREFGFLSPCLIERDTYNIIAGHGRVEAAKRLGMKTVPCVFVEDITEAQRKAYILADNRLTELGEWDMDTVNFELQELNDMSFNVELTGFDFDTGNSDWFDTRERYDNSRQEGNEEYNDFLEKFEIKKTTDDCYTPDEVYEAVAEYVATKYNRPRDSFVRPFYPDGDYQNEYYPSGCVVVDNPPFSILNEILCFYVEHGIDFFLFAPTLTLFTGRGLDICFLAVGIQITYENGAKVNTSFITSLEHGIRVKTEPELYEILEAANKIAENGRSTELPSYDYPPEVVTAAGLSRLSVHGVQLEIASNECERISALDAMKNSGKAIFGGGFLVGENAAQRNIEAQRLKEENKRKKEEERFLGNAVIDNAGHIVWELSEREREIVKSLTKTEEKP